MLFKGQVVQSSVPFFIASSCENYYSSLVAKFINRLGFLILILFALNATAQNTKRITHSFYPEVIVNVPMFIGAGGGYSFNEHIQADLLYGITPQPFYSLIGQVAAESGGNGSYRDVVEAAFQNNSLWRLSSTYNLTGRSTGFHFTVAGSMLEASGDAEINSVLRASTGRDYSTLIALLIAAGRSSKVHIDSSIQILELQASYSWSFDQNWVVDVSGGFLKVLSSDVNLKTGLSNYESTPSGNSQMRETESEIEGIIEEYGLSPTAGVQLKYLF
ncbi:MAG: hypothetical protein K0R29_940 [Pseudobdellovibrio sp.]|jgi:hypothetical protein|nr:hypothetical protein [Pseudobdellovibrio sp.]